MPELKITIDNIDRTDFIQGLESLDFTFVLNQSDKTVGYTVSGELTATGPAYNQIAPALEDVKIEIRGELIVIGVTALPFIITTRAVSECGECDIRISLEIDSTDTAGYEKLARSILTDGTFGVDMAGAGHTARIPYCNEPNAIAYMLAVFYLLLRGIIGVIVFIISIFDDDTSMDDVGNFAIGCAKYHIGVNIREACRYWTGKAGLSFSSSILSEDHPHLHLLDANQTEGLSRRKQPQNWSDDYLINYTVPQLLGELSPVFNADYRIIKGVLHFEPVHRFPLMAKELKGEIVEMECIEPDNSQLNTYLQFRYAHDLVDEAGNKIGATYNGIQDFNPQERKALRGGKQVSPRVAMSRFNADGKGDTFIRALRKTPWVGTSIVHDLILSRGVTSEIRIIDLEPGTGYRYATRIKLGDDYLYQGRLRFRDGYGMKGLNTRYHYSQNPNTHLRYTCASIRITPENICQAIDDILDNSMNVYLALERGRAIPGSIAYDIQKGQLELRDCTIWPW